MGEQGKFYFWGARDGTVVRVLASHQSGPGSNPGIDAINYVGLLLVLSFAPRGFSPGTLVSPLLNTNISKFPFDQESGRPRTTLWMCHLQIIIYLLFIIYLCGHLGRILWFTCVSMYHCSLIKLYKIKLCKVTSLSLYMYAAIWKKTHVQHCQGLSKKLCQLGIDWITQL